KQLGPKARFQFRDGVFQRVDGFIAARAVGQHALVFTTRTSFPPVFDTIEQVGTALDDRRIGPARSRAADAGQNSRINRRGVGHQPALRRVFTPTGMTLHVLSSRSKARRWSSFSSASPYMCI